MDYEKKYKKALERAEKALEVFGTDKCEGARQIFSLFPELKKSEDERIRNWLIGYFHQYKKDGMGKYANGLKVESIIAWLEKQDPKKHEDELEKAYKCADEVQYRKGYEDAKREIEKQSEQNPTDLEIFISELSKQFPDVSFAKLSRIAVRVAKWVKPCWSEENKKHIIDIIDYLDDYYSFAKDEYEDVADGVQNEIRWLQSI